MKSGERTDMKDGVKRMPKAPSRAAAPAPDLTAEQVAHWLSEHPGFLERHPELLKRLVPPARDHGDHVVDMQHFMLERLQGDIAEAEEQCRDLVAGSRLNMSSQTRIHKCVLALLSAWGDC